MVSDDLAHWKEISSYTGYVDAFVPGRWNDPVHGVPACEESDHVFCGFPSFCQIALSPVGRSFDVI